MKFLIVLTTVIISVNSVSDEELWVKFKKNHSKTYSNLEEVFRFSIFQSNLRKIEEHNIRYENGQVTYYLNINQFADLLDEEFEEIYLNYNQPQKNILELLEPQDGDVPYEIDWRAKGVVTKVKDQGSCGAGWAFSAIGALESQNVIHHNISMPLSEQQFIDCVWLNNGCEGGSIITAYSTLINGEIFTEDSYPYSAVNSTCKNGTSSGVTIQRVMMIIPEETNLRNVVGSRGPVSIGINGNDIKLYGGGIFNNPNCSQQLNHNLLAVGYGTKDDLDYWIIKNSWSANWGEDGYIYLARNKGKQCGVGLESTFPVIL